MKIHHVVVDGSNIATEARSLPSLAQLDEAVKAFLAEFEVDKLSVIVDATFGHRIDASERAEFDQAIANGELVTPPAGAIGRGDAFVLQAANRVDAVILSNDSFQEFHGDYPWLFDEGRLMGGKPVPGVGWVFLLRTPVRGPASRKSQRDARRKQSETGATTGPSTRDQQPSRRRRSRGGRSANDGDAPRTTTDTDTNTAGNDGDGGSRSSRRRKRSRRGGSGAMVNEALPFIEFVAEHPVDSEVEGTVSEFSSHGAYVNVGEARCYLPLHAMGDPTPQRARDRVGIGEIHRFVVTQLDAPRRGIDVRLVPDSLVGTAHQDADRGPANEPRRSTSRRRSGRGPDTVASDALDNRRTATTTAVSHEVEEDQVAVKKATKKAAKKATKKAPARKAAKKATKKAVKKAPARKAAKKATKKAAKKATKKAVKKAPARKAAKKATKKATKKAPARRR